MLEATSSHARRARPNHLEAGLLTSGWAAFAAALPRTFPGLGAVRAPSPVASLGFAPRSQWRDRAGLAPASLFGPSEVPSSLEPPQDALFDWAEF